jgi:putative Ca2+/H+ antiporter (TMEM165/GDT1 family)
LPVVAVALAADLGRLAVLVAVVVGVVAEIQAVVYGHWAVLVFKVKDFKVATVKIG